MTTMTELMTTMTTVMAVTMTMEIMNTHCKKYSKVMYSKLTGYVLVLFLPIIDDGNCNGVVSCKLVSRIIILRCAEEKLQFIQSVVVLACLRTCRSPSN